MVVVASGVGGTGGAGELVTVRRENMKLNIVHVLNTWMTHVEYSTLFTTAEEMTRNKYLVFQLLWAWLWLSNKKQNHTSVSVPLLCGQSQGCQEGVEQDFTQADAWSWNPDQCTKIIHTCCSRCCVFCRGCSETGEKKTLQVKNSFPSAEQVRDTQTQQTCRSHLRAGQWCCCPGQSSRVRAASAGENTSLCCHVAALGAWGCLLNTTLELGAAGIKFLTCSALLQWGLGMPCWALNLSPPMANASQCVQGVGGSSGSAGRLKFWEWDDQVPIWVYIAAVCFHQGQCFSFPFCCFIVPGSHRKGSWDYVQF